jgi:hypothetical protein
VGPLAPDCRSYFGVHNFSPKLESHYVHTRDNPPVAFARFQPKVPSQQWDLMHQLPGYRLAAVRCILTPVWVRCRRARLRSGWCSRADTRRDSAWIVCPRRITLVRSETWFPGWSVEIDGRPTAIHSADGLFQAVTVPAGSHHIMFSFVPPGMDGALLGWLAGVAVMLVPAARSASSFRVRG